MTTLNIKQKDLSEVTSADTVGHPFWRDPGPNGNDILSFIFDPWNSNEFAQTQHTDLHCEWVQHIHKHWLMKINGCCDYPFEIPAVFDWGNPPVPVFIIGRGPTIHDLVPALNTRPDHIPTIFLNDAYDLLARKPNDYTLTIDNRILTISAQKNDRKYAPDPKVSLIAHPGIDTKITLGNWKSVYGFTFWSNAHLNNHMRNLFPDLPPLVDQLSCILAATHLAAMSGANPVIFVGTEFCEPDTFDIKTNKRQNIIEIKGISEKPYYTVPEYAKTSNALGRLCHFAAHHMGTRFINASGRGILGYDILYDERFENIKIQKLDKLMRRLKKVN